MPGEYVSSYRDGKNHQPYQSYKLVGTEYRCLNIANDNSQNSFKGDESNHCIRPTPKDPRPFGDERRKVNNSNWNWNRNQGTLNAKDPGNNSCHSPTVNTSKLHNQHNLLNTNSNNSQHFDMSSSHTSNVST